MNANEPVMTHRKSLMIVVKSESDRFSQDKSERNLLTDSDGNRCKGGMILLQALIRNVGTWPLMRREMTSGQPPRGRIPMQRFRGGAVRSSEEDAVMVSERRDSIIRLTTDDNNQCETIDWRTR